MTLAGTPAAPGAEARAYLDPENQRLTLVVYKLPPPPPGTSYQLWVILGDVPISAGVFDVDAEGRARERLGEGDPHRRYHAHAVAAVGGLD